MGNTAQHPDRKAANRFYRESLELYRSIEDDWGAANVLAGLGEIAQQTSNFIDSIASYEESLALFRTLGDPRGAANSLIGLGNSLFRARRMQEGEQCVREMISLYEELGTVQGSQEVSLICPGRCGGRDGTLKSPTILILYRRYSKTLVCSTIEPCSFP